MKGRWPEMFGWSIFLVIAFAAVCMMSHEEFDYVRPIQGEGKYLIHEEELVPKENVDVFIAEDEKLFVFFIDNELVNVYDQGGKFLYGIQFPDCGNGRSDMAFRDGILYVDARGSGRYAFENEKLLRFEEQSIHNDTYHDLDLYFENEYPHTDGESTYVYVAEENKFIRIRNGCTADFVQFPKRNTIIIPLLVLDIGVLAFIAHWKEKKQNQKAADA